MAETGTVWWRGLLPEGRGLSPDAWRRRHDLLSAVLLAHVPVLYALAIHMGFDPWHSAWEVGLLAAAALAGRVPALPRAVQETAVSIGLLSSSALLVHTSGGYIEAHFHFFIMLPLVAMYQRWLPFLFAVAFVVLHHGVAGVLDPAAVYNHPAAVARPWTWAAVHALFISLECVALFRLWREVEVSQDAADRARSSADRLLAVQEVKERLLRLASHELITPLTPIRLQLSLMEQPEIAADPARRTQALHVLERNFRRLERIVDSVLDAVRIGNDSIRLRVRSSDVARLAQESLAAYGDVARARGVVLHGDLSPSYADVDGERMAQVFDNLLSNAIKYTPPGGHVALRVHADGREVVIEVDDTGRGLDADQITRLFQPFGMVHSNEDSPPGTGLGLYICKGIVEGHGGQLGVSSRGADQGARFWARLPAAPLAVAA